MEKAANSPFAMDLTRAVHLGLWCWRLRNRPKWHCVAVNILLMPRNAMVRIGACRQQMIVIDFSNFPGPDRLRPALLAFLPEEEVQIFEETCAFFYNQLPDRLAVSTSGSTGVPKTYFFERSAVEKSISGTLSSLKLEGVRSALLALPLRYVAGRMMLLRAMYMGWKLTWFRPALVWDQIPEVDFAALIPAQLVRNVEVLNRVGVLLLGGGQLSSRALELIRERARGRVYQSFSTTETLTNFAFRELAPTYEASYKVMEGVCIRVDEESVLHVRYPGVTDGEVCTGDLVELTGDNAFVWKGRKDFLINSGGVKVSPEYLEGLLSEVLVDKVFVVSAVEDEVFGERLVLVMEGDGSEDASKWMRQIDALYAKKAISRAIKPLEIRFMEKLPVTQTGKPDRRKVRTILNRS